MRNPSSILRGSARHLRHPSPAMAVALLALFLSIGGASYAATAIPDHSVGANQLKTFAVTNPKLAAAAVGTTKIMNSAVTYNKIKPSSVGTVRVVKSEVQLRLKNSCPAGQAISAVDVNGNATCVASGAAETNSAAGSAVAVSSSTNAATISTLPLAAGSAYMVQSAPYITVKPSTDSTADQQNVTVTCTLNGGTAATAAAQRSATFVVPAFSAHPQTQYASIPLAVVAPSSTSAANATVTCTSTDTNTVSGDAAAVPATITAQGQIYGTQLASATTATTPTTTTTTTSTTPTPAP